MVTNDAYKKRTINRLENNGTTASIITLMFEKDNPKAVAHFAVNFFSVLDTVKY